MRYNTKKNSAFGIEQLEDLHDFYANIKSIFTFKHSSMMSLIGWFFGGQRIVVIITEKEISSYDD